jgi:hypothetical protein
MAIPVEVFASSEGVFLAVPAGCALFDSPGLTLIRKARVLRATGDLHVVTSRLPVAALTALEGVGQLPVAAFSLGGVVQAVVKPLTIED